MAPLFARVVRSAEISPYDSFDLAQPGYIRLGIGRIVDTMIVDEEQRQVAGRHIECREHEPVSAPARRLFEPVHIALEELIRQPGLRAERRHVELAFQLRSLLQEESQFSFGGGRGVVVQPAVLALEAQQGHALGRERDPGVISGVEESLQSGILLAGPDRCRTCEDGRRQEQQCQYRGAFHGDDF